MFGIGTNAQVLALCYVYMSVRVSDDANKILPS